MSFTLLPFQDAAVKQMLDAVAKWVAAIEQLGAPPSTVDHEPIPLLAQLSAITGGGKTPMLAKIIGGIGPAVVLWTTNRSVVVDQTVEKLRRDYVHMLPPGTRILGEDPPAIDWDAAMTDENGLVIWCRTVASWNAADDDAKGTPDARLSIHRSAPAYEGDETRWTRLANLARPLWVVYDEGHGQTDVQLDQLLELGPVGIITASATPMASPKLDEMRKTLLTSRTFGPIAAEAWVSVSTSDVAKAGLLKTAIEVVDQNMDAESKVLAAAAKIREIEALAEAEGIELRPRAIYVTEESNSSVGDARPVAIWKVLTERGGVPTSAIAIATTTKEIPPDADRITDLSQLKPSHRHIIFNKKFQEGWDDPEAYVAYFDGETRSATRIKQLIGRVVRQPGARHFVKPDLNAAWLLISSPDTKFASIVEALKTHLVAEFGVNEFQEANVKVTRTSEKLPPLPLRGDAAKLSLPVYTIVAKGLEPLVEKIEFYGRTTFDAADLEAPGQATRRTINLTEPERQIVARVSTIGHNIRSRNRDYFLDRVREQSREAFDWLPVAATTGPMFKQSAAALSRAQSELARQATEFVTGFVERVRYAREADPDHDSWSPGMYSPPSGAAMLEFERSLHARYPDTPSFLNPDEKEMAQALDAIGAGRWLRNPPTQAQGGYGVPLASKLGSSQAFFPDFLWWIDGTCWAIDTTGVHLLGPKVRGKLLTLTDPHLALVTRGRVAASLDSLEQKADWTLVLPGDAGARRLFCADLRSLLDAVRAETTRPA